MKSVHFWYRVVKVEKLQHIPDQHLTKLKTKLRMTCEKYNQIRVPYKYQQAINSLKRNPDIVIIKQDKGRGVVILDNGKYTEKCLKLLNTKQFKRSEKDPTTTVERKIQKALRNIKSKLPETEYKNLYPTGSSPGKLYGKLQTAMFTIVSVF